MQFYDSTSFAATVYPGDPNRQQLFSRGLNDGERWAWGPSTPELFDLAVLGCISHRTGDSCHRAYLDFCLATEISDEPSAYKSGFIWAARCVWNNELRVVVEDQPGSRHALEFEGVL